MIPFLRFFSIQSIKFSSPLSLAILQNVRTRNLNNILSSQGNCEQSAQELYPFVVQH